MIRFLREYSSGEGRYQCPDRPVAQTPDVQAPGDLAGQAATGFAGTHALNLLEGTDPADRNGPVATLLRVFLDAHAGRTDHRHITQPASGFTAAETEDVPRPSQNDTDDGPGILFQVRLADAATDLGAAPNVTGWNRLADRTLQIGDAYAAREALAAPACRAALTADRVQALTSLVHHAALSTNTPPTSLLPNLASLSEPLQLASNVIIRTVNEQTR